jgi:hypothetical protein
MGTFTRVFSDAKTVDSRALNLAGIQPLRAVLARTIWHLRRAPRDPLADDLRRDGYVVVENFLAPDVFAQVSAEAADFVVEHLPTWLHTNGTTEVRQFVLAPLDTTRYPRLAQWRTEPRVLSAASAAERRSLRPLSGSPLIEDITYGEDGRQDSQTRLHADAIFNTHKVWLYLDDVEPSNAPLVYVPGSQRFDRTRLGHEYRGSITEALCTNPSRRISAEEVSRRGLEPKVFACARNTLIIANTCGYHARSIGEPGATRRALHMSFRSNPFGLPKPRVIRAASRSVRKVRRSFAVSRPE